MSLASRPPGCKRLLITLAIAAYVAMGVPVWWYTTRLPRPVLPHAKIQRTAAQLNTSMLLLPAGVHVYIVQPGQDVDSAALAQSMLKALNSNLNGRGVEISQVTVVQETDNACDHVSMTNLGSSGAGSHQPWALPYLHLAAKQQRQQLPGISIPAAAQWHQLDASAVDAALQLQLEQQQAGAAGQYVLFVLPGGRPEGQQQQQQRVVIGQYRHAWVWAGSGRADGASGGWIEESGLSVAAAALAYMIAPQAGVAAVHAAKQLPTSPSGDTILQFTLANGADGSFGGKASETRPQATYSTWDFDRFQRLYVQPLAQALAPVVQLHVQSQVRLHMAPGVPPRFNTKHQAYVVRAKKLPFFVGSDWSLDFGLDAGVSHGSGFTPTRGTCPAGSDGSGLSGASDISEAGVGSPGQQQACSSLADGETVTDGDGGGEQAHSPAHVLHMVLYVPPVSQQPFQLLQPDGAIAVTNSFSIPSWGAVHILSTTTSNGTTAEGDGHSGDTPAHPGVLLDDEQLHEFAQTIVGQLRVLLGLPEMPAAGIAGVAVELSSVGVSAWEVDALSRARAASDIAEAARVLGSFSRLAQALPNLEMPDVIGTQVSASLSALTRAVAAVHAGRHAEAVGAAREAHAAAESAFSHPAVLAQLSFPESHKVGVYVPFFMPALLPVVMALVAQVKRSRRRWREHQQACRDQRAAAQGIPPGLSVVELDQLHMMRSKLDAQTKPT